MLARFGRWWTAEFLSLFPPRLAEWLTGSGSMVLLLSHDDTFVNMRLQTRSGAHLDNTCVSRLEYSATLIDDFLQRHQLKRQEVTIRVVLPADQFFKRTLVLPIQAARSVNEIVAHDLTQKTPFKLTAIHYDHEVIEDTGKLVVTQCLIKRDSVKAAALALQLDVADIDFVETASGSVNASPWPAIRLKKGRSHRTTWPVRAALALSTSAALLALTAGGLKYWRQETILNELRTEIAKERRQAEEVRSTFAKIEHRHSGIRHILAEKLQGPGLLDIWEATTHLLPADTWLTELSVTGAAPSQDYRVAMSGFSAAAAKLVGVLDQSPLFRDAALTTAIAVDPIEQRERFALQAKVRLDRSRGTNQ